MIISINALTSLFFFLFPIVLVLPLKLSLNQQINVHPIELFILFFIPVFLFIFTYGFFKHVKQCTKKHFFFIIYITVFIIFITASSLATNLSKEGAVFIVRLIYLNMILSLLLVIKSKIHMKPVVDGLLVSSCLLSLYIILDNYFFLVYVQRPGDAFLGGAVGLIPSIALGILIIKALIRCKPYYIPVILLIMTALYLNGTRTWMLSIVVALAFIILFSKRYDFLIAAKRMSLLLIPLILLVVFYILSFKIQINSERLTDVYLLLSGDIEATTLGSRLLKWYLGTIAYLNSPIWGTGMFNLNLGMPSWVAELSNQRSDNQLLDLLFMCGPIPFIMFNAGFIYFIKQFITYRNIDSDGLIAVYILTNLYVASFFWAILDGYILYGVFYLIFISAIRLLETFGNHPHTEIVTTES